MWWFLAELGRRLGHDIADPAKSDKDLLAGVVAGARCTIDEVEPASLVLTPRRQMRRLTAQFDFLGDPADVLIHPEDGAASGVVDGKPVTVRSAQGHVEANVNGLTDKDDIDVITGMVRYSGVLSACTRSMTEHLRVVQWATGNIGRKALRGIIEHPTLSLAGVHVYDPDKVLLAVAATGRIEDVPALDADCVLYTACSPDIDEICRTRSPDWVDSAHRAVISGKSAPCPQSQHEIADSERIGAWNSSSSSSEPSSSPPWRIGAG